MQTLSEVSIAVVGFTGIIAVYQRVNDAQGELARWRVYTVLTTSLTALLFSSLPTGLALLGLAEARIWQLCSGLLVLGYAGVYGDLVRTRNRLSPSSRATLGLHPWYARTLGVLALAVNALLVLNASGLAFEPDAGVYYLGVLNTIATSCTIFGRTVFGPQAQDADG